MPDRPASPEPSEPPVPPVIEGATIADDPRDPATVSPEVAFDGPRGRLSWLLIRNLLLNFATLGIYRFWAKTHVRRFFWRHTNLLGERLEYTGTGGELFIGFLIVMAVLVPLIGAATLAQLFVAHFAVQFLVPAVLFLLTPVAIYRMWRYRFSRTLWRGVRFGLDGSSLRYAALWLGLGALTIVTLGLATPWRRVVTTRYLLGNARFGRTELSLDVRGGRLFLSWLAVPAVLAAVLAALAAANASAFGSLMEVLRDAPNVEDALTRRRLRAAAGEFRWSLLLLLVLPLAAFVRYRAVELRYLLDNLRAGKARLRSELRTGFFVAVHLAGWTATSLIVIGLPILLVIIAVIAGTEGNAGAWLIGLGIFGAILIILLEPAYTLFVEVTVLAHVCRTLAIENPAALDDTVQSSAAPLRRGEGLADALDIGGF